MRDVPFTTSDFDLFGQDISPTDYEFFKKHTGAFKRLLEDQPKEKKLEFVDAFKDFSLNHGCLKDCPTRNDSRVNYLEEVTSVYYDHFVNGRFSTAKNIVMDAVTLAQNKHLLQYMGHKSYAKDPFFNKETRDVFRRLFGLPSVNGTFIKVICVLPLHIKFGGSICRYLRRWLDAGEPVKSLPSLYCDVRKTTSKTTTQNSASASQSATKKKEKEEKQPPQPPRKKFDFELFERQVREVFDYDTSRFDFTEFRKALESMDISALTSNNSKAVAEEKPPKKPEDEQKAPVENPQDEGLSLREYFGFAALQKKLKSSKDEIGPAGSNSTCLSSGSSNKTEPSEERKESDDDEEPISKERIEAAKKASGLPMETFDYVDKSFEEIKKMLLLNKPHPNDQFMDKKTTDENKQKLIQCKLNIDKYRDEVYKLTATVKTGNNSSGTEGQKTKKRHACSNCRKVEPEPKMFKKCQRCRGKGTRFYCSRHCQETDWVVCHREDHNSIEDVT